MRLDPSARRGILFGGLAVGVLDLSAAMATWAIRRGVSPVRVAQSVASGALGPAAFQGGAATAALGVLLHFGIAFTWATVFAVLAARFTVLLRRPVLAGAGYGVFVYAVMYGIVLPLSRARSSAFSWELLAINVTIHLFCVGLPIALLASRAARRPRGSSV